MTVLVATPKAANANSFLTVARADTILGGRLYTTPWDNAAATPDAEGFTVDGDLSVGTTTIAVVGSTGTFTTGTRVRFGTSTETYVVGADLTGAGDLTISPGLVEAAGDGDAVVRVSGSQRERALIMATTILHETMVWLGTPTTDTQALHFPAWGVLDDDGREYNRDVIPPLLEVATAEMALELLRRDRLSSPGVLGLGLSRAKVGPVDVQINDKQQEDVIPRNVLAYLTPFGTLESEARAGASFVHLRRV